MTKILVQLRRLEGNEDIPLPRYTSAGAAGMDLPAAVRADLPLDPGRIELVPCGLCVAIPEGYEGQVRPRSGLALKGITLINSPGTIDSDYRGEIKVPVVNLGHRKFVIKRGIRIAQLVIAPVAVVDLLEVRRLPATARGSRGFGHTGTAKLRRRVADTSPRH